MLKDKACMPLSPPDTTEGSWLQCAMASPVPLTCMLTLAVLLPFPDVLIRIQ